MVLQEQFCYKQMQKGSAFQKLRGHKKFSRVYKLSTNLTFVTWYPTRTRGSKLLISDIKRVKRGVNPNRSNIFPSSAISYSLTIFLQNQTVELLATTNDAADIWLVGLRYLVYRATSHENTVRGMWLSEEFKHLVQSTCTERVATTTPTNSTTERNSPQHLVAPSLPLQDPMQEGTIRGSSSANDSRPNQQPMRVVGGDVYSPPVWPSSLSPSSPVNNNTSVPIGSSPTVNLHTCIARIKELSYYCAQFSLASLSARDSRSITEREFIEMYEFYSSMDPVLSFIFQFNSNGDDYLTCDELAAFLRVEFPYLSQVDEVYLSTVVEHYEPIPILRSENCLGIDGLITYLLSPDLSVMNPFHTQVNQDMSHPITHYFINSSHNSFLTVVLDLENHCSIQQQVKMAHYLRDVFKESLFVCKGTADNVDLASVPLVNLRGNVFVKCKRISNSHPLTGHFNDINNASIFHDITSSPTITNYGEVSDENSADELPSHCKTFGNTPSGNPDVIATPSHPLREEQHQEHEQVEPDDNYEMLPLYEQRRKQHILLGRKPTLALSRYLSALVSIKSKAFTIDQLDLDVCVSAGGQRERNVLYQINERDAVLQVRQKFFDMSMFCESNLVKLSPSSSRVNSSNPDPVQFWNAGIQMVALNQQKQQQNDKAIRFNKALFKSNGNCGYCLKPIYASLGVGGGNQEGLELEVMFFFISRIQAFIQSPVAAMPSHRWTLQVEIKGHMNDTSTRYIDCMNLPVSGEKFIIHYPSMAFFCLTLYEELSKSRKFSSDFVIPVTSIAAGFKVVPLLGPSSCVVIVDINANSKPPPKETKRRRSFLRVGAGKNSSASNMSSTARRRLRLGDLKESHNRQSFEIYQSHSFRFSRSHNISTPNLVSPAVNSSQNNHSSSVLHSPSSQTSSPPSEIMNIVTSHNAPLLSPPYSHTNNQLQGHQHQHRFDHHLQTVVQSGHDPEIRGEEMGNGMVRIGGGGGAGAGDFGSVYEAHCATVGVPNASSSSSHLGEMLSPEQRVAMNTNSLMRRRTTTRSSIHELAMSSIANLFKENNNASMVRNHVLLGKSALNASTTSPTHVAGGGGADKSHYQHINGESPGAPRSKSNYNHRSNNTNNQTTTTSPLGGQSLGMSNEELRRAHQLFEGYSSVPIYDSPLEDQVTQSCHNSPLHQETIDHYERHSSKHPLTQHPLSSIAAMSTCTETDDCVTPSQRNTPHSNEQLHVENHALQQTEDIDISKDYDDLSPEKGAKESTSELLTKLINRENLARRRLEQQQASKQGTGCKYPNSYSAQIALQTKQFNNRFAHSRSAAAASGSKFRSQPKSVIRGRASSLSDNDQFSSDEELDNSSRRQLIGANNETKPPPPPPPPRLKRDASVDSSMRRSSIGSGGQRGDGSFEVDEEGEEENLNLSNLAAEIEEEFGGALCLDNEEYSDEDCGDVADDDDDEDLMLYSQSQEQQQLQSETRLIAPLNLRHTDKGARGSHGITDYIDTSTGLDTGAQVEKEGNIAQEKDDKYRGSGSGLLVADDNYERNRVNTRHTSGYESGGLESSPPLPSNSQILNPPQSLDQSSSNDQSGEKEEEQKVSGVSGRESGFQRYQENPPQTSTSTQQQNNQQPPHLFYQTTLV
ncbi:uncharacterized protein LOC142351237 isoform X2 [Convolutriloba macropyga]|uniref:uncharacterized protein LOC142351237 isoform X2 n=1 Tax=Convolutriloba macropyga TaxID=536237 RepID=UPI003F51B0AF